ncbi:MAG: hypothetical protein ACPH9A_04580 [Flavobacteriaceae bacterium]
MKRSIITTADGSKTIQIEEWSEQYHSVHGALQEAKHVYIKMGLHQFLNDNPNQNQLSVLNFLVQVLMLCLRLLMKWLNIH